MDYYEYVLKQKNTKIITIEFSSKQDEILRNTSWLISYLGLPNNIEINSDKLDSYYNLMNKAESNKETAYSALPSKERTLFKKEVILSLRGLEGYEKAMDIYRKLIAKK
ncbi:MAG: hypothetical protein ACJAWO_001269 [Halieaceae bacterium]|jgi:hypothetical protein